MKVELGARFDWLQAAEGDAPTRTISGLAVPWDVVGYASTGPVRFERGSIPTDGPAPKLLRDHDVTRPIGIVSAIEDSDSGLLFDARISEVPEGDIALRLALDGVLDAVSVGVDVEKFTYDDDVLVVKAGRMRELSLLPFGAFEEARVANVAASEVEEEPVEGEPDTEPETETETPISEEEKEMQESTVAVEATIATAPVAVAANRKVTAAEYISAVIRKDMATVKAAWKPAADAKEWPRARLWRGLATENITQAAAHDLLRESLRIADAEGLCPVAHVHDEILVECDAGDAERVSARLHEIMTTNPAWAPELPLAAEGSIMLRYGK